MVKRLKTNDDSDRDHQQPYQQQQQQQQQQHQQQQLQQQNFPAAQVPRDILEEAANEALGPSNNTLFQTIHQQLFSSTGQSTTQSITQHNSTAGMQQLPMHSTLASTFDTQQPSNYQYPQYPICANPALPSGANFQAPQNYDSFPTGKTTQNSSLSTPFSLQTTNPAPNQTYPNSQTGHFPQSYKPPPIYSAPAMTSPQVGGQGGGSVALYVPPAGGAQSYHRGDMQLTPGASHWPVPKGFLGAEGSYRGGSDIDNIIQGSSPEPARGPPVAQYPQRNIFAGIYGLRVTFPGESPKLVVKEETEGKRQLYTELDHYITTVVRHSADDKASMRFLVVYSKDCEVTQPVNPCKNHQNTDHPNHMLDVRSGTSVATWYDEPHPSVVVAPSPSSKGEYTVQMKFLCRNSCVTRKNLTLICQLEREGQVVGRECLELKVSACPRRDAKMSKKDSSQESDVPDAPIPRILPNSIQEVFAKALESGRRSAYLAHMEMKFRELHPQDHAKVHEEFSDWWDAQTTKE